MIRVIGESLGLMPVMAVEDEAAGDQMRRKRRTQ